MRRVSTVLLVAAVLVPLACRAESASGGTGVHTTTDPHLIHVVASFYPLQFVVERVGGALVSVTNLTPTGAEPHELELTAKSTAALADAGLVVYLSGFAPAVDAGVQSVAGDHALDVADGAHLDLTYTPIEAGKSDPSKKGTRDPHFWLDPTRLESVVTSVAARLTMLDPADAATFTANAAALTNELQALDGEYRTGLASCTSKVVVTSHNAFGYLSRRYGLTQVGITGLTPEDEPSPDDLARVSAYIEHNRISTIYYETLVSPVIARTVAAETGAKTMILDPIEGLVATSQGSDYFGIMRSNLANLRVGQGCS